MESANNCRRRRVKWLKNKSATKSLSSRRYMWRHKAWRIVGLNILRYWSKNGVLEEEVHRQSTVPLATVSFSLHSHLKYTESTVIQLSNLCTAIAPWSGALLEEIRSSPSQNIPTLYGTRIFIIAFTRGERPPKRFLSRSILILSYHLRVGLLSGLFASDFPIKTLHAPLLSKSLMPNIWQV